VLFFFGLLSGMMDGMEIEIWNFPHRRIKQHDKRADFKEHKVGAVWTHDEFNDWLFFCVFSPLVVT
jgi:hypothetical protein